MKKRTFVVGVLTLVTCALTRYFHGVVGTDIIFPHVYYLPIILAAISFERRSWFLTAFLSAFLLASHVISGIAVPITSNLARAASFLLVGGVAAELTRASRLAGEALQASYRHQAAILESMLDVLVVTNPDGIIYIVNPAALELLGYAEEELIGRPVGTIFEEEEEEEEEEELAFFKGTGLAQLVREGTARDVDLTLLARSGERIPAVFNGSVLRDEDGDLIAIVSVARDIRERKKAEEELRRFSEELELKVEERTKDLLKEKNYIRHLIESSPDFQMTLDKDGRIMDVNEAFEDFAGRNRRDIIGTSVYGYLPRKEIERLTAEILEKEKVRNIEMTMDTPKKGVLTYSLSGTAFTTPEGEPGVYTSGRDMTEVRRQQEELLEKERQLAHSARLSTLGEMATATAHEINQPLTVISMAAEGILRDIKKDRVEVSLLPQDLEDILRNVQRIDRIITHMRTFARQAQEWTLVEPEQVLSDAFIIVGEQFKVHAISVSRDIEENLPPIEVDPNQLEQVFLNILTNARQALDEKGEAAERANESFQKLLVCRIFQEGDQVVFEFADNGCGVPDGLKSRIFEPFFTTKEPGQGTGLGLSIAYNIVTQALRGNIWVEDSEMGGASFKVALPIANKGARSGDLCPTGARSGDLCPTVNPATHINTKGAKK
ncbi:MAG: PAS domain S-box protein [Anaerolineae bacterium]|nr:PAS domain S-box protein [Anaerolineae bacterium]